MKMKSFCVITAFLAVCSSQSLARTCNGSRLIKSEKINFQNATKENLETSLKLQAQKHCFIHGLGLNHPVQRTATVYSYIFEGIQLIQADACFSCVEFYR